MNAPSAPLPARKSLRARGLVATLAMLALHRAGRQLCGGRTHAHQRQRARARIAVAPREGAGADRSSASAARWSTSTKPAAPAARRSRAAGRPAPVHGSVRASCSGRWTSSIRATRGCSVRSRAATTACRRSQCARLDRPARVAGARRRRARHPPRAARRAARGRGHDLPAQLRRRDGEDDAAVGHRPGDLRHAGGLVLLEPGARHRPPRSAMRGRSSAARAASPSRSIATTSSAA